MQNSSVVKLHMAKSLEELNKLIDVNLDSKPDLVKICKSAGRMFDSAQLSRKCGDEEKSYILYMRYISFVLKIQDEAAKSKDKGYFESMLGKSNIKQAHEWAEKLSSSLEKRYTMLKCEEETSKRLQEKKTLTEYVNSPVNVNDVHVRIDKIPQQQLVNGVEVSKPVTLQRGSISCRKLYEYLENKDIELLIIDVRPSEDYLLSHIKNNCCINVPAEIITPGVTAPKLEPALPPASLSMWNKRSYVEVIVLLDWDSSLSNLPVNQHVINLKKAIYEYDVKTILTSEPLVLSGGYESWLNSYPTYTTNSHVQRPRLANNVISADDILVNFEYPDLDKAFLDTSSSLANSTKSTINLSSTKVPQHAVDLEEKNGESVSKTKFPTIDRTTKPKIVDLNKHKSLDDSSEQLLETKSSFNSTEFMNDNDIHKNKPVFDRSAKPLKGYAVIAGAFDTARERFRISDFDLKETLDHNKEVTEADLQLEKDRLQCEKEVEKVRSLRENETEERKLLGFERQEYMLLGKLKEFEEDKIKMDTEKEVMRVENEKLKATLKEMKKQSSEENEKFFNELENMKRKEQEKLLIEREANRLRLERVKRETANDIAQRLHELRISPPSSPKLKSRSIENSNTDSVVSFVKLSDGEAASKREAFASRGLSRSQSFPNISQALDSEEMSSSDLNNSSGVKSDFSTRSSNSSRSDFSVPSINRNVKPSLAELNAASNRNLMPVFGGQGRGLTGLRNLGNSCYMNAILQCLSNTVPLAEYFVSRNYKYDVNRNSTHIHPGELVEEYAAIVHALHVGQYRCISPKDFKRIIGKYQKMFAGCEQQDAQELLMVLMEYLHEDLNQADKRKAKELQHDMKSLDDSNLPVVSVGQKAWEIELQLNRSIFVELFQGQFISTVTCCHCSKVSSKFDTFSCVSLPIPPGVNKCNLKDCLQLFRKEEKMTGSSRWKCPRCKELREAKKKIEIYRLPHILLIHLKRFFYEGVWRRKLQTHVDFPVTDLAMRDYIVGPEDRPFYNLYAITNHYGTLDGGHYTAFCKNVYYNKWFKFDDHEVQEISLSNVKSSAAYILYYVSTS